MAGAEDLQREILERKWRAQQIPEPKDDPGPAQRSAAWGHIEKKRRDPDHQIPPKTMEAIKRHWTVMTQDMSEEEVEKLKKLLGL